MLPCSMQTLFDDTARANIVARLGALRPDSPRGWGKMDPAQALAHCAAALEAATGDRPARHKFIGRILGPFFRASLLGPKPFGRDAPTDPSLVVADPRDFARERTRLVALIGRFADAGPGAASGRVHAFLGPLSGDEWGRIMHKHLDHHLTQFGVT